VSVALLLQTIATLETNPTTNAQAAVTGARGRMSVGITTRTIDLARKKASGETRMLTKLAACVQALVLTSSAGLLPLPAERAYRLQLPWTRACPSAKVETAVPTACAACAATCARGLYR
jgi:hypothetical protein